MLPSHSKTWNFNVNNLIEPSRPNGSQTGTYLTYQNIWYQIKEFLKSNGWTVIYSCNGVNSPSITIDQWSSPTAFRIDGTSFGSQYPWIVLRNSSMSANFDIMIVGGNSPTLYAAPQGFLTTGGSVSSAPSTIVSNDRITLGSLYFITLATSYIRFPNLILHCVNSSDYKSYKIYICYQTAIAMELCLEKVDSTPLTSLQWTVPFVYRYASQASLTYTPWNATFLAGGTKQNLYAVTPYSDALDYSTTRTGFNDYQNQVIMMPYVLGTFTSYTDYICPSPADTYLVDNYNNLGSTFSDILNSKKFAVLGSTHNASYKLAVPWNGSSVRIC